MAAGAAGPSLPSFYLKWPIELSGDTIPAVTVTALYEPPESTTTETKTSGLSPVTSSDTTKTTPSPDQWITLLDASLPQVHPLYYYNVSTGLVASSRRSPSYYRVQQAPAATDNGKAQYQTVRDDGDRQVFPVLFFSIYLKPFDAESPWSRYDWWPPSISLGFSLTSPSKDFFLGLSFEARRNVQLTAGLHVGKVTALAPSGYVDPTSSTAPTTKQQFKAGAFLGATFNIDFIKGLFGGGGGK